MKNAVMNPHAMNAAMFGMIMPDKKRPELLHGDPRPTRPAGPYLGVHGHLVPPSAERPRTPTTCPHRAPSRQVACRALSYGLPARTVQQHEEPASYSGVTYAPDRPPSTRNVLAVM